MKEVSLTQFQLEYKALTQKDRGRALLVEDHEKRHGWIVVTFIANQETIELPPEEINDFLEKYRSKLIYKLLPLETQPSNYLRVYENDSDDIKTLQAICLDFVNMTREGLEEAAEKLAYEIVNYFRILERSGETLTEMLLDAEKALTDYQSLLTDEQLSHS